jgi:transcriptional regulator with XRE-family HTH domain
MPKRSRHNHILVRVRANLGGLNQHDFAALTGCSFNTLQSIELGRLSLSPNLAERIGKATGINPRILLANDPTSLPPFGMRLAKLEKTVTVLRKRIAELETKVRNFEPL